MTEDMYSDLTRCLCGKRALVDSQLCQECEEWAEFDHHEQAWAEAEDTAAREAGL